MKPSNRMASIALVLAGCLEPTDDENLLESSDSAPLELDEHAAAAGPSLRVTFAGTSAGEVSVIDAATFTTLATCTATCTVAGTAGQRLSLAATTPSIFAGLSGACTSATNSCSLTLGTGRSTVTATNNRAPGEVWTRFLGDGKLLAAAFDRDNALIVASPTTLTKLTAAGKVQWTLPIPACAVATGPGNSIYVHTSTTLMKLKPTGATIWSTPLLGGGCADDNHYDGFFHNMAVGRDGAVAVAGLTGVARWDAAGALTWTKGLFDGVGEVGIDPQGRVGAGALSENGESVDLHWFTDAGAELPIQEHIASQYSGMLVIDPVGRLLVTSSGHSHVDDSLGHSVDTNDSDFVPNGIAAAASDAVWIYHHDDQESSFARSWTMNRYKANGSLGATFTAHPTSFDFQELGTNPHDIAGSLDGRIAVVGELNGYEFGTGWVTVYDP
jgi:hypothetical protein